MIPSVQPTCSPSQQPTGQPARSPSTQPSSFPSYNPSFTPSLAPTDGPTEKPSAIEATVAIFAIGDLEFAPQAIDRTASTIPVTMGVVTDYEGPISVVSEVRTMDEKVVGKDVFLIDDDGPTPLGQRTEIEIQHPEVLVDVWYCSLLVRLLDRDTKQQLAETLYERIPVYPRPASSECENIPCARYCTENCGWHYFRERCEEGQFSSQLEIKVTDSRCPTYP